MQMNSIRIKSWDALFTMFTTLEPESVRMAVLRAIADPETVIGYTWDDCLFAVATQAVDPSYLRIIFKGSTPTIHSEVAKTLGIPLSWVNDGIELWDNASSIQLKKRKFRNRIRKYLADLEKTQATEKANVRELTHV